MRHVEVVSAADIVEELAPSAQPEVLPPETEWRAFVGALARTQMEVYRLQPRDLIGHANREKQAVDGYRGRQLLELVQNADDACEDAGTGRLRLHLTRNSLVVANTGTPFSNEGIASLVVSDSSPKQLTRNRYIGCKGLGFRSVLTWTDAPSVVSGPIRVRFNRRRAADAVQALRKDIPELDRKVAEFVDGVGYLPVPVMRFPFFADDEVVGSAAESLLRDGFVTVIELPFINTTAYHDAMAQLRALTPESLLFCRHLEEIEFAGEHSAAWRLSRTPLDRVRSRVEVEGAGGVWTVHRREGRLERASATTPDGERQDYELAIAVPEHDAGVSGVGRLSVFFPTRVVTPIAPRLHATLDLTDDRNGLIANDANRGVLRYLAEFLAHVVEAEAGARGGKRALRLLSGLERIDPILSELGFTDSAINALRAREIFPCLDGAVAAGDVVRRPPSESWLDLLDPTVFPKVLDERQTGAAGVLHRFELQWYDRDELTGLLQQQVARLDRTHAGKLVGTLLARDLISHVHAADLLLDADGRAVGRGTRFFLHPSDSDSRLQLPPWVTGVRLLDPAFQAALLKASGLHSVAMLTGTLCVEGCEAEEYGAAAIAKAVIDEAEPEGVADDERRRRWRDVIHWLFRLLGRDGAAPRGVTVKLPTGRGDLAPAGELYLGAGYVRGALLDRLYGPFGRDEFVASPEQLGLAHVEPQLLESFLVRLGVSASPRMRDIRRYPERTKYLSACIDRQRFPLTVRGTPCDDAAAVRAVCTSWDVEDVLIPDRLPDLLRRADPAAIAAYFLGEGAAIIATEEGVSGEFQATSGREYKRRPEPNVRLINAVLWMLRESPWIPCEDGQRHVPRDIALSARTARLLEGVVWRHGLAVDDPLLARHARNDELHFFLTRLGAVTSLDTASDEAVYALLWRLPDLDPEGKRAREVYRTLTSRERVDVSSTLARQFHEGGKVWALTGKAGAYVPVDQARYNANRTLTRAVERELTLLALPKRRSATVVEAVLGVKPLRPEDVRIDVRNETPHDSTALANAALRRAVPFLYALRLHRKADDDAKEQDLFAKLRLHVCRSIDVEVVLPDKIRREPLDQPGDAIASGSDLYVVGAYEPGYRSGDRLWQDVARLLSELLTGEFYAEALLVLQQRSVEDMEDAVRGLLQDEADAKLEDARTRIAEPILEETPPTRFPLPPPANGKQEPPQAPPARNDADAASGPPIEEPSRPPLGPPELTSPPEKSGRVGERRRLVIAPRTTKAPGAARQLAHEDTTFWVVGEFERCASPPRYVVPVSWVRGSEGFGCDLVSVASPEIRDRVERDKSVCDADILRYIEVKGRSQRTGDVELDGYAQERAEQLRDRYFLYRVYVAGEHGPYQVAVLPDPMHSPAVKRVVRLDLSDGSGARWFEMNELEDGE